MGHFYVARVAPDLISCIQQYSCDPSMSGWGSCVLRAKVGGAPGKKLLEMCGSGTLCM